MPALTAYEESKYLDKAHDYASAVLSEALKASGPMAVIGSFKPHWNGLTGSKYGAANCTILENVLKVRGLDPSSNVWMTEGAISNVGGVVKQGMPGALVVSSRVPMVAKPVLDAVGQAVINPETGNPDTRMEPDLSVKRHYYARRLYNVAHETDGVRIPVQPLAPQPGARLKPAVKEIWGAMRFNLPATEVGKEFHYDAAKHLLTLPPGQSITDVRPATHAAYQVALHLAEAAAGPHGVQHPLFCDDLKRKNNPHQATLTLNLAASMVMAHHCEMWDPKILDATANANITNIGLALRDRGLKFFAAQAGAERIYKHMIGA